MRVELLSSTPYPQTVAYAAMIQDYSEENTYDQMWTKDEGVFHDPKNPGKKLTETEAGNRVVKNAFKYGHFGIVEHPQIVVNVIGFPHTTIQQLRTHRHLSWDVQSGRYTGQRIINLAKKQNVLIFGDLDDLLREVSKVFYIREPGVYADRFGHSIEWTVYNQKSEAMRLLEKAADYSLAVREGMPYEMARDLHIPYCIIQNAVASGNLRSWLHLLEMRGTKDAELECQIFSDRMVELLTDYAPEIVNYWKDKRYGRNKLAP